ncbi:MAG: DUF6799 domain-containing protein, partial [Cyclobacteriaceae bacterium]
MKRVALILAIIGLGVNTSFAQTPVQDRDQNRKQLREHVMFQDGQMYQIRNGERLQLQSELKLKNGIIVNPDGTYNNKAGKMFQFKNGECMGLDGKKYRNQNAYMTRMNRMEKKRMNKPGSGQKMKKGPGKKGKG